MSVSSIPLWTDLPEMALFDVLRRLPSLLDLFAFAGVCHSWRAFLRSSAAAVLASRPPLLLSVPVPLSGDSSRRVSKGSFHLYPLDAGPGARMRSSLPLRISDNLGLGFSQGHLIVLSIDRSEVLLLDAFTGSEIRVPLLAPGRYPYTHAILTAPLDSPDCRLLLFFSKYAFSSCRLGGSSCDRSPEWFHHRLTARPPSFVNGVLSFKSRCYAINDQAKILLLEFIPEFKMEILTIGGLEQFPAFDQWHFGPQLVECAGELMLVLFKHGERGHLSSINGIDIYRLDFREMKWVEVEDLGEHCLFIACGGRCPISCPDPSNWGGSSNCVYLAAPGCHGWTEYSLRDKTWRIMSMDGRVRYAQHSSPGFLSNNNLILPRWPSPVWVYPSLFFSTSLA